ncbi:Hypothetical protein PHPALM_6988 [Phytophthora palmivora]|uniref:Uncharacterized protein n=1 Tax=Phytophthora palmivora TaxID=4796 RepID=A0A2P4YDI4_9STRA|nr:Hypothetical protein PHPALM_6988 [Phytophthora palmivora]
MHPIVPSYPVFNESELDIDYIEVIGPCMVLACMTSLTFNLGTDTRDTRDMLLVAKGPGYVYVDKTFKELIIAKLQEHFGYTLEAHEEENGLLKWHRRRITAYDLYHILNGARVPKVVYIDYAMKASIESFSWIDGMLRTLQDVSVIVDVATVTKPSDQHRVRLVRLKSKRVGECRGENYPIYAPMQSKPHFGTIAVKRLPNKPDTDNDRILKGMVYSRAAHIFKSTLRPGSIENPGSQRYIRTAREYFGKLYEAYEAQRDIMGDVRTEIRFRVHSIGEIAHVFSQEYANLWSHLFIVDTEVELVLKMQKLTMEWAESPGINLFRGRDEHALTQNKKTAYTILLNAFGIADRFSNRAVTNSTLIDNLKALLVLNGVRMGPVITIEDDNVDTVGTADNAIEIDDDYEDQVLEPDSEETELDPDMLFRTIYTKMVVTKKRGRNGGVECILRDHFGAVVTRQRSEALVAHVIWF